MIIKGKELEFIEEGHIYIYDGIELPSITQMLKSKFSGKFDNVPPDILRRAAELGTQVHEAIERYETLGEECDLKELYNWKFLKRKLNFECIDNEVAVVLFDNNEPIACGRLDLVLQEGEKVGLGDIKRTATLDKDYLFYQLNLYRIAYQQCYDKNIEFLRGIHLREDTRKYVEIPINEDLTREFIENWRKDNE